jgi:hypothetical protein
MSTASSTAGSRGRSHLNRRTLTVQELLRGVTGWRRLAHLLHDTLHASRTHHWLACTAQWSCDLITTCNSLCRKRHSDRHVRSRALPMPHLCASDALSEGWKQCQVPSEHITQVQAQALGSCGYKQDTPGAIIGIDPGGMVDTIAYGIGVICTQSQYDSERDSTNDGRQWWAGTIIALSCQKATLCDSLAPQSPCKALAQCLSWLQRHRNMTDAVQ